MREPNANEESPSPNQSPRLSPFSGFWWTQGVLSFLWKMGHGKVTRKMWAGLGRWQDENSIYEQHKEY